MLYKTHEEFGVWRGELCFPDSAVVKNPPANAGDKDLIPGSGNSPGEGNPLVFLPGESHGQKILAGYIPWGYKRVRYD